MMSKREFLKLGMGGTAGLLFGSLLKPESLLARSCNLQHGYLESSIHSYWMKLSYNHGQESRETRSRLGFALRNLGAIRGFGLGFSFVSCFDQAVEAAFRTGKRPGSLFALIQMLYDDYIFPQTGVRGGEILFGMLFALLRGRDGTGRGEPVYQSYLDYRAAAIAYKNAYMIPNDPGAVLEARQKRKALLNIWQQNLRELVEVYARRDAALDPNFRVQIGMLEGFEAGLLPVRPMPPRLAIYRFGPHQVVTWKGGARLQQASSLSSQWTDAHKSSPATFDSRQGQLFFRTIQTAPNPVP